MGRGVVIFRYAAVVLLGSALLIAGCAKKPVSPEAEAPSVGEVEAPAAPAPQAPAPTPGITEQQILERARVELRPVYFDFDKSDVRMDSAQTLQGNGAFLKEFPMVSVRLEGNADERGTNEYNLALGERRAQSVKDYLTNLGISPNRITTLSYGEERPVALCHDESCWWQNRRVDPVPSIQ